MEPNQELFLKIKQGYRMDKPPIAHQDIYKMMLGCWKRIPEKRPTFADLECNLGSLLQADFKHVRNHQTNQSNNSLIIIDFITFCLEFLKIHQKKLEPQ